MKLLTANRPCEFNLVCEGNTCRGGFEAETCDNDGDCVGELYPTCINGKCDIKRMAGDICKRDSHFAEEYHQVSPMNNVSVILVWKASVSATRKVLCALRTPQSATGLVNTAQH